MRSFGIHGEVGVEVQVAWNGVEGVGEKTGNVYKTASGIGAFVICIIRSHR